MPGADKMNITTDFDRKAYWEKIYKTKESNEVSWHQDVPTTSLDLIEELNLPASARIFDNGGGDSYLVDNLLKLGYNNITVQDISESALDRVKKRLGVDAAKVRWVIADEAHCNPQGQYDLWHDRAAFHFLIEEDEIKNYVNTIQSCIKPGGHFIIGTFSEQGPKKCSGLDIRQYSEKSMTKLLGDPFEKVKCLTIDHHTPFNSVQNFLFCTFKRKQNHKVNTRLTNDEIARLDPYQLMVALGKKVIHPGGKQSTKELYEMANFKPHHSVLEIGCGVGTTGIDIVRKYGCNITLTDIDHRMIAKAVENVKASGLEDKIKIAESDILQLPFPDHSFDLVVIEAVTMFVDRQKAIEEIMRVCKPKGIVIEHEFIWRKKPTTEARKIFEDEICPGIDFDSAGDWISVYEKNGFRMMNYTTGPFLMMTPMGFLKDEGILNTLSIFARAFSRLVYLKKMMWLMPRIMKVKDSLSYIVLAGEKIA